MNRQSERAIRRHESRDSDKSKQYNKLLDRMEVLRGRYAVVLAHDSGLALGGTAMEKLMRLLGCFVTIEALQKLERSGFSESATDALLRSIDRRTVGVSKWDDYCRSVHLEAIMAAAHQAASRGDVSQVGECIQRLTAVTPATRAKKLALMQLRELRLQTRIKADELARRRADREWEDDY